MAFDVTLPHVEPVQPSWFLTIWDAEYDAQAMSIMKGPYPVVSDDVDRCRRYLGGDRVLLDQDMDHEDLFLMAARDAQSASSTFSSWGAGRSGAPTVHPRRRGHAFDIIDHDVPSDAARTIDASTCESGIR